MTDLSSHWDGDVLVMESRYSLAQLIEARKIHLEAAALMKEGGFTNGCFCNTCKANDLYWDVPEHLKPHG